MARRSWVLCLDNQSTQARGSRARIHQKQLEVLRNIGAVGNVDLLPWCGLICPRGRINQIVAHGAEMEIDNPGIGAASMAMSFGARPKLLFLFQGFAVLMGLASAVAALRLMVSLTLTAVPIFVIQLVLGKPRLLLAIAFYLSLYGLKFQRFVRMFSASHVEAHRRQGYFSGKCDKVFGRYLEFFLGYLYGNIPELGRTVHVCLHHRENSGPDDTRNTIGYDRTRRLHFLWYLSDNIWTVLGLAPYAYFKAHGDEKNRKRMLGGMARYYAYFAAVF